MRVLLDNNVIPRFAQLLPGHEVSHARQLRWHDLQNGALIAAAEEEGFAAIVTADKDLRYQQNLKGRKVVIVVLNALFIKWPISSRSRPKYWLSWTQVRSQGRSSSSSRQAKDDLR